MEIEEQEIDHVTVDEAICQVAHDSRQEQSKRHVAQCVRRPSPKEQSQNDNECDAGQDDKKRVVVLERSESRAVVCHIHEIEEIVHNGELWILRTNALEHQPFRNLVQNVKRKREKEDESHLAN